MKLQDNNLFECRICRKKSKTIQGLSIHISTIHKNINREEYYKKYLMKNKNENICEMYGKEKTCQKYTKLISVEKGFKKYCSIKCMSNDPKIKEKKKQNHLNKHGVEYPNQRSEIKEKKKQTCLDKYGVTHVNQVKEFQEKHKQTCLNKYGVENISQVKEFQEKKKQNCLNKHGVEYNSQTKEFQEKRKLTYLNKSKEYPIQINEKLKKTCLHKYNEENPMHVKEFREKYKQTCLDKYGVEYISQVKEFQEKKKQTCLDKYGVEHISQVKEFQEKKKQTCLTKYGVEYPMQVTEFREKLKKTCLDKYGVEYISQVKEFQEKGRKKCKIQFLKKLNIYLEYLNLELLDKEYINDIYKHNWKCQKCGHKFKQYWKTIKQGILCPMCFPKKVGSSYGENEIYKFIYKLVGKEKIKHNCWNLVKNPKTGKSWEIDIYIPDKQIAFEYNGLYWHSEEILKNPNYHLQKMNLCFEKNIQLIHIFEDEWIFKKEIVKFRIKQILNRDNNLERIHPRKYEIKELTSKIKNEFLEKYHIQGKDNSEIKLGLFDNSELISVITFKKRSKIKDKIWELNRFCSNLNFNVSEIIRELLSHFKKNYEWKEIFSYIDRRWSQGNLYYQLGFKLEKIIKPNYWYTKGFERIYKFNLKQNEGYSRIWDCGRLKFNMHNMI